MHSSPECPYGPQLSLPGLHSCCVPWDSMMRIFMATPVFMCRLRLLRGLCMPAWPRSSLVLLPAFAPQRKGCGGKKKMASWEEHGAQCCCAGYQPCTAKKRRNRMKPTKIQCSWSVHLMEGSCGIPYCLEALMSLPGTAGTREGHQGPSPHIREQLLLPAHTQEAWDCCLDRGSTTWPSLQWQEKCSRCPGRWYRAAAHRRSSSLWRIAASGEEAAEEKVRFFLIIF